MMDYEVLENKFSQFIGTKGCIAVNTGTASLHLALEALELPEDSEVIVPQFTMIATAWAIKYARLKPVFIDCDDSLLIDIDKIEEKITSKTRVLMVTHIYGRTVNMKKIMYIAEKYNLRVIEDAAEAHGCKIHEKMVGSYDIGCFSFYRNKIIRAEEGGAITSNDTDYLDIVRDMKSMSFGKRHNYMHSRIGFNYRMTNGQARMVLDSLAQVEKNIALRRSRQNLYNSMVPKQYQMPSRDVPWVYDINVPDNTIVENFRNLGIPARYGFKPVSMCAPFNIPAFNTNAYKKSKNIMYLPIDCSEQEIGNNCRILKKLISKT